MTIKPGLIKSLLLGAVCAAGLAAAAPEAQARTYYYASIGSDPYYRYDRYDRYDRRYYRHRHGRDGFYIAFGNDPYRSHRRSRYRCYTEWDGDRVCYRTRRY